MTDNLRALFELTGIYNCAAPYLIDALRKTDQEKITDLCSGSGGAVVSLRPLLSRALGREVSVALTDKFPHPDARINDPGVWYFPHSADAARLPESLPGFRTLFTSFHHFKRDSAKEILADAVKTGNGIGIFEITKCNLRHFLLVMLTPVFAIVATPFLRPLSPARLFWTYIIPIIPLFSLWDGILSNFRSYSEDELKSLVSGFDGYEWTTGTAGEHQMAPVQFLIGIPAISRKQEGLP